MQTPFLYTDRNVALARLRALGLRYDQDLDIRHEHARIGVIDRLFGVLGNLYEARKLAEDRALVDRLQDLIDDPDNQHVKARLVSGALTHTPVNKRTVTRLDKLLHARGVHLPWAFRPMNVDLGLQLARVHQTRPLPFGIIYSQNVEFNELMEAVPGRLFSLPIAVDPKGTWDETIYDHLLDEDVGLMVEVDVLVTEV